MFKRLLTYSEKGIYPFHMPGHKRNADFLSFGLEPALFDITEIPGMDNLARPEGIIKDMEKKAANLFGADSSYALINGSTGGILAAMLSQAEEGDTVIIARNSHMSAYSSLALGKSNAVYIYPKVSEYGFAGPISACQVEEAFKADPDAKAVFIVSPTYEGFVSDIKGIADTAHSYGAILIADEAHGAHLGFHNYFPESAVKSGADIVIQSLHKTLPALTQCALLHVNGVMVNKKKLRAYLNMVNTSSPSYVLMASIDKCLNFLGESKGYFDKYADNLEDMRCRLKKLNNFTLIDGCFFPGTSRALCEYDKSKLVFGLSNELLGMDIENILSQKYKIQIEMACKYYFLAMTSVCDSKEGFLRLINALEDIDRGIKPPKAKPKPAAIEKGWVINSYPEAETVIAPGKALGLESEMLAISRAVNRISTGYFTPYPPGIPLLAPGERISLKLVRFICSFNKNAQVEVIKDIQ